MRQNFQPSPFEGLESRQMLAVDLTAALQFPSTEALIAGASYQAAVTVTNSGDTIPSSQPIVHLFASPGAAYNSSTAVFLAAGRLTTQPRWGNTERVEIPFTLPQSIADGAFVLVAMVDPQRQIVETDEGNNFSAPVPVQVTGGTGGGGGDQTIDLTAAVSLPVTQIVPNTPVVVRVSVTNEGTGPLGGGGTFVQLFLARSGTPSPSTDLQLGLRTIPTLAPGASDAADMEFTLTPEQAVGTLRFYAVADLTNQTVEVDETNNVSNIATGVGIGGVSDLAGVFISESLPSQVVEGAKSPSRSSIKFSVRNAGDYPLSKGVSVVTRAYLRPSLDASGDSDIAVSSAKKVSVSRLAAQAARNIEIKIKTPKSLAAGDYWLIVKIDDTDLLPEFSEGNNMIDPGSMFSVVPATVDPALSAGTFSPTPSVRAGKTVSAKLSMSNLGNSIFKSRVTIQLVLLDASGAEVAVSSTSKSVRATPGRDTRLGSFRIKPPAPGEYTLVARLILPEGVTDIGPTNNTWNLGALSVTA